MTLSTVFQVVVFLFSTYGTKSFQFYPAKTIHSNVKSLKNVMRSSPMIKHSKISEDTDWKSILSPEAYEVLREDGTEPPWSSELNNIKEDGVFLCAGCKSPLFITSSKFESGSGWPSFTNPLDGDAIKMETDFKLVVPRTECRCSTCDGHLGHVFNDGPMPTGMRYCMNGVAMEFQAEEEMDEDLKVEVEKRVEVAGIFIPRSAILPDVVVNAVLTIVFLNSFLNRLKEIGDTQLDLGGRVIEFYPLVGSIVFGFFTIKALLKLK